MIISIIPAHFKIKIQPNMNKQEKKRLRIYDLFNVETKPKKISAMIGVSLLILSSLGLNPLVGWGCRIHRMLRWTPTCVLDMTLNNLILRFR